MSAKNTTNLSEVLKAILGPFGTVLAWARDNWGRRFFGGLVLGVTIGIALVNIYPKRLLLNTSASGIAKEESDIDTNEKRSKYVRLIEWKRMHPSSDLLIAKRLQLEEESSHLTGHVYLHQVLSYPVLEPKGPDYFRLSTKDPAHNIEAWMYAERKNGNTYTLTSLERKAATGRDVVFEISPRDAGDTLVAVVRLQGSLEMQATSIVDLINTVPDHPQEIK